MLPSLSPIAKTLKYSLELEFLNNIGENLATLIDENGPIIVLTT